jgi:cell wall-associated NlpC family hydrolase
MAGRHRRAPARRPVAVRVAAVLLMIVAVGVAGVAAAPPPAGADAPARWTPAPPLRAPSPAGTPDALSAGPSLGSGPGAVTPVAFTEAAPDDRASVAVAAAMAQIGLPYVWGGNGPTAGDAGFDCSGLTRFAYAAAGIALPRTAHTQYYAGPRVPSGAPLHPGDLVFYGVPERVHHVGLFIGDGKMVNAPTFGQPVQVSYYRWRGDDYLGATRPAADPDDPGLLPPEPAPLPLPSIAAPRIFEAPRAPVPTVAPRQDVPQRAEPAPAEPERRVVPVVPPSAAPSDGPEVGKPPTTAERPDEATPPGEPAAAAPPPVTVIALPAGSVDLSAVETGPDGLPGAPGSLGAAVVRVQPALLAGAWPGASVTVTRADGVHRPGVVSREVLATAEVVELLGTTAAPLTVLAAAGDGRWTVLEVADIVG